METAQARQTQQVVAVGGEDEDEAVAGGVGGAELDAERADEGEVVGGDVGGEAGEGGPGALGPPGGEFGDVLVVEDGEGFGVDGFVDEEEVEVYGW